MRVAVYAANSTVRDNIDTALTSILGSFDGWVNPTGTVYYKTFPVTRDELDELRYEFGTILAVSGFKFSILDSNATLKSQIDEFVTAAASETNFFVDLSTHSTHIVAHCNRISGRDGLSATRQAEKMAWNALHKFGELYKARQVYSGVREVVELDPNNLPDLTGTGTEDILYENKEFVWATEPGSVLTLWPADNLRSLKFKNCKFTADFRLDATDIGMLVEEGCESSGAYFFPRGIGMLRVESLFARGNKPSASGEGDYNYALRIANGIGTIGDTHRTRISNNSGLAAYPAGSTSNYTLDGSEEINTASFTSLDDGLVYSYEFDMATLGGQRGGITIKNMDADAFNTSFVFAAYCENIFFLDCTLGGSELGSGDVGGNGEWVFDMLFVGGTYTQPVKDFMPGLGGLHRLENVLFLDVGASGSTLMLTPNGEPMQGIYIQGGNSREAIIQTGNGSKGAYVDSWITLNVDDHATGKLKFLNRDSAVRHLDPVIVADSIAATQYTTPQRSLYESTYADFTLTNSTATFTALTIGVFYPIKGNIWYSGITSNGEALADNPEP